ncbi:MAG: endonuclease III [Candidatus Nanoarchaeia archaeon]|nr:endonuclease III [Candidatus Nanoarchaeia archaeon]MDD5239441.1 endonuclease III [Candidatus Nanoarchaeia archaeon]
MAKPIDKIISELRKLYGKNDVITIAKGHPAVFELLIRTILAARNTDENALAASKELFARYKTPQQISKAPLQILEKLVKRGVFYKVKARSIRKLCGILAEKYNGKVPKTMEELTQLPGVGRKTANIILTYGFGTPAGIAVDTHVFRTVNRIGIVNEKTPEKTETALLQIVQRSYWQEFNSLFVDFGRDICQAKKPQHERCPLRQWCDFYKNLKK